MKNGRVFKRYNELFSERMLDTTISDRLQKMEEKGDKDVDGLREVFCDKLLHKITVGQFDCPNVRSKDLKDNFQLYEDNVSRLPKTCINHWMTLACYEEDEKEFYKYFNMLVKELKQSETVVTEKYIVDTLIIPLKDALPEFWSKAHKKLSSMCENKGVKELCRLMDKYFSSETFDATLDPLKEYVKNYPDITVAKEYLAHAYEGVKGWKEEIACLQSIRVPMFYAECMEQYYFDLAYAYGKLKYYTKEEEYYRKSIAIKKDTKFANNNLAWCLYEQGNKNRQALKIFRKCVDKRIDIPNSANGYLRVLLDEGYNPEAKDFIRNTDIDNIDKKIVTEVKRRHNIVKKPDSTKREVGANGRLDSLKKRKANAVQFSSERALEDELVATLEANKPIFGKYLKVYESDSQYGRQYIIPKVGIIDILCEDSIGDMYVIELKKDAGYKDAYDQIKTYMRHISKEKAFKDKRVYGIICLNSPPSSLIAKVRKDDDVSLFEYQITLKEYK